MASDLLRSAWCATEEEIAAMALLTVDVARVLDLVDTARRLTRTQQLPLVNYLLDLACQELRDEAIRLRKRETQSPSPALSPDLQDL